MGIPKFFRWLTRRYPMILQTVVALEDIPPVDNLYLDLNGIVHNAIHGNDPKRHERISKLDDLEELWASIMRSIDELVHVIKPKKMLLLAVDGVAPRAKMNQQRARRFKSAKEREMLTNQLRSQGKNVPEMFDTNAISPGTEFMINLCEQLHFFIKYKINTDPLYQDLTETIISDGNVPGEGEHKMLDYIRQARMKSDYNPNTRHCYYGSDADLIMLSLLTHEPHFTIIREEHIVKKQKNGGVQRVELSMTNNFQLIHISLLREYFGLEYRCLFGKLRMRWDLERIIDDFIFFCFFIGNDFLPSISALDIAEGSLDQLIEFYKMILPNMDDYITHQGTINWDRAEKLIWILGEHENEVFKERIDSNGSRRNETRTISVTQESNPLLNNDNNRGNRNLQNFNMYKEQIYQKKVAKVAKLKAKSEHLKYKKFLITKIFKEDAENKSKMHKEYKVEITSKFQELYLKHKKTQESKQDLNFDGSQMLDIIEEIDQDYFSDLRPEDIPDDCVSDIGDNVNDQTLESLEETAERQQVDSITNAAAEMVRLAEEANMRFMNDFVKLYAQDPNAAKATYYMAKVQIDIRNEEGQQARRKMMKKYLEGIQWVLYYYYRGAQHWRWYYPFHYAPLISDLGVNIVKDFLGGNPFISKFEVDYNCPLESHPYTPFQQLLSIMPIRSFKLLPTCYRQIAVDELRQYFPDDFSFDLNGKTLAWEAIVLIPFVDEKLFLEAEHRMIASGVTNFSQKEKDRNQWTFSYDLYKYNKIPTQMSKPLKSTLRNLQSLPFDYSSSILVSEYETVGDNSFTAQILPGCIQPSVGYPSFQQLGIIDIEYETIVVRKVQFKKVMVKIPQCIEETQPEKLEEYLWKLAKQSSKEVYIDLPFLKEAFPMYFEDQFSIYTLYGDVNTNQFTIQQAQQWRSANEWEYLVKRVRNRLTERGIFCPPDTTNVLVSCNKVQDVLYSSEFDNYYFYKTYFETPDILPLSLVVRRRDPSHYLNIDARTRSLEGDLASGKKAICLKTNLFGVMGTIDFIDFRKQLIKMSFDKLAEESKVHDPFMGQKHLQYLQTAKKEEIENAKAYFGESDIDQMLGFKFGVTARITSSFMITYKDPETNEKSLVDVGLNMKSWTKQMHVPGFVRFTQNGDDVAVNQYDGFNHNQFSHGSKHVRSHWEYSLATVQIIKEYNSKFPLIFEFVGKCLKKSQGMPQLKDLYGSNDQKSIQKLKQLLTWIDSLPVSHLPFVDMGFDALTPEMIQSLNQHRETVQKEYQPCNLLSKTHEWSKSCQIFVERFPFWTSPFSEVKIADFKVGQRVMNINSTRRDYIPFGLRGTVVGKTEKQVMVLFDEQFLQGTDINGHCEMYRGAILDPVNLINLTKKFQKQLNKSNCEILQRFTEVDPQSKNNSAPQSNAGHEQLNQNSNQGLINAGASQAMKKQKFQQNQQTNQKQVGNSQLQPVNQKQPSTSYAQTAYKAKAYQPLTNQTQVQKTVVYQQKQGQKDEHQDEHEETKVHVFIRDPVNLMPNQKTEKVAESTFKTEQTASSIKANMMQKAFDFVEKDPAILIPSNTNEKGVEFAIKDDGISNSSKITHKANQQIISNPSIFSASMHHVENAEESTNGMPKIMFAPIKSELQPSAEFQQLLAEMSKQPQTAQDLLSIFGQATGPSHSSSSTSQAMMNTQSIPFEVPKSTQKGQNPE